MVPFDAAAAALFDQFRADKRFNKMDRGDLLNACVALATRAGFKLTGESESEIKPPFTE